MAGLTLNNSQIQGQIYSLGNISYQEAQVIKEKGQNDGLDQVYFKSGDQTYFIEGDGLNLSALKAGVLPEAQFMKNGELTAAKVLFVDNESNTAIEGAKSMIGGAVGVLSAALVGGTTTSVYGSHLIQQGSGTIQQGTKVIGSSFTSLGKSLDLAKGMLVDIDPKTNDMARELTNLFRKKAGKPPLPKSVPEPFISVKGNVIETKVNQALKGEQVMSRGVQQASKGARLLKSGLYVAGIGVAVAGTALTAGAIYSANRSEHLAGLAEYRHAPID